MKVVRGCLMLVGAMVVGFIALIVVVGMMAGGKSSSTSITPAASTPQQQAVQPAAQKPAEPNPPAVPAKPEAAPAKPAASAKSAAVPAKVGDRVESGGIALTVVDVDRTESMGSIFKAKPGRTYLVAEVTLETTGREKAPYNPMYFKVKDSEGFEYTAGLAGDDNGLKSGELTQGDKVRGTVAFDVPTGAKGFALSYQPLVIFGGYQTIRVALD